MAKNAQSDKLFQRAESGSLTIREGRELAQWMKENPNWESNPKYKRAADAHGARLAPLLAKLIVALKEHEEADREGRSVTSDQFINFLLHRKYLTLDDLDKRTPGEVYVRFVRNPMLMKEYWGYLDEYMRMQEGREAAIEEKANETPARKKEWSNKEVEELRRGAAAGKTINQLKEFLPGRTEGAIKAKIYELKLDLKHKPGRPTKKMLEK